MSKQNKFDVDLSTFAKALAYLLTLFFWLFCIGVGYYIANDDTEMALVLLLILGAFLPIAVRAAIGLIQEKYSGRDMSAKDMHVPIFCTFIFLMSFYYVIYLIPTFWGAIK